MTESTDKNEIFNRLAHFIAPNEKDNLPEAILEFVIKQTLITKEGLNEENLKVEIKKAFDLSFEEHEIKKALESLTNEDLVTVRNTKYYVSENERKLLNKSTNEIKEEDEAFYIEVSEEIARIEPLLNDSEVKVLTKDLEEYINHLFSKLGAEAVNFLYPDKKALKRILKPSNNDAVLDKLTKRDSKINSFRKKHFSEILSNLSKGKSKTFLANKLNAVFIYTLISIDPKCSSYLQKTLRGYELYIDTNILYDLLGLNEKVSESFAKKVLSVVKKFNFKVFVTARTLEEFNISLSNSENFLRQHPVPTENPELLKAGADVLEEAFIKSYWNKYADEKVGLEEFLSFYKNIKPTLQKMGIEISNKSTRKFFKEAIDDEETLQKYKSGINQFATYKKEPVLEHDGLHMLMIRKIREAKEKDGSLEIKHWFLTKDRSIYNYELSLSRRQASYSPSSVLIEHLMQILRPLLPRSENFEQSLLNFVTDHRQAGLSAVSPNIAVSVLNRINRYRSQPKDVAIKVLTDAHFNHKIQNIKDKEKLEEAIDNEFLRKAELAINEKEEALKNSQELGSRARTLEAENKNLKDFKKEIEEKRKRKSSIMGWSFFSIINAGSLTLIVLGVYHLINYVEFKGVLAFGVIILAFILWLIILIISSRSLPNNQGEKIISEIKDIWTQVSKIIPLISKKD